MENRFLRVVKEGIIDELDTSIKDMVDFSQNSDSTLFTGLYRKNISSGMSVLRTLARKAAEDAGVSVITIDIITQRAVQKIDSEMRQSEIIRITKEMIRELTEEVRKENILLKGISPSISRCINHIRLHYAENITFKSESHQKIPEGDRYHCLHIYQKCQMSPCCSPSGGRGVDHKGDSWICRLSRL